MMDKKILWRTVHAGFLTGIGLLGTGIFSGTGSLGLLHVFGALGVLFLLTVLGSLSSRGRGFFLAAAVLFLAAVGMAAGEDALAFCQSCVYWLTGGSPLHPEWIGAFELVRTVMVALLCYAVRLVMEKDSRLLAAGILALGSMLLYFLFAGREISRAGVAFMLCYGAVLFVERTQIHWKKEKGKCLQAYMLWLMPFFAAYFFLLLLPETPQKPYDWRLVKTVCIQLKESFLKFSSNYLRGNGEDFDLSLSGFSEQGRLGGRNEERREAIMTVENEKGPGFSIYLIGKVYDTFDGRQWEQKGETVAGERYMDTAETLAAVRSYDRRYQADYLAERDITVRYKDFRTRFLFAPLKLRRSGIGREEAEFTEAEGSLAFDRKRGYGTEYELSFFQMNAGQEAFRRFLEEASVRENNEAIIEISRGITGKELTEEDIQRYRQGLPARYVQGFCVPAEGRGETVVYSDMAHAWPEVYLEGIGWIPFEPTPGYGGMRYPSWRMQKAAEGLAEEPDSREAESARRKEEEKQPEENREKGQENREKYHGLRQLAGIFSVIGLGVLFTGVLLILANRLFVNYRYERMDLAGKFKTEVYRNLRLLAFMGIRRRQEETLEEFGKRAGEMLGDRDVLRFLENYEDFCYGDKVVEAAMVTEAKRQQKGLEKLLKGSRKWGYVGYCIFSGFS